MSDPLLSAQRRVDCLAAQRRPVVFPLHRDSDGAGDAERLAVVLLGHDTWRETKGRREVVKKKRREEQAKHFLRLTPFSCSNITSYQPAVERDGHGEGWKRKVDLRGEDRGGWM